MFIPISLKLKIADLAIRGILKLIPGDSQEKKYEEIKNKVTNVIKQIPDEILEKGKTGK